MGITQVTVAVSNPANKKKRWEGLFLVDTGAVDSVVPSNRLRTLGIKPEGRRSYELADGTKSVFEIAGARLEFMGELVYTTVIFGKDNAEPILGVTALESVGIEVDPRNQRLKRLPTVRLKTIASCLPSKLTLYMQVRNLSLIVFLSAVVSISASAQSLSPAVIASTGNFSTGASFSLSATAGELLTTTLMQSNSILTQGFQQPDTNMVVVISQSTTGGTIELYPNPVQDHLFIALRGDEGDNWKIEVMDILGRRLIPVYKIQNAVQETRIEIDTRVWAPGVYFIQISDIQKYYYTCKIIKT